MPDSTTMPPLAVSTEAADFADPPAAAALRPPAFFVEAETSAETSQGDTVRTAVAVGHAALAAELLAAQRCLKCLDAIPDEIRDAAAAVGHPRWRDGRIEYPAGFGLVRITRVTDDAGIWRAADAAGEPARHARRCLEALAADIAPPWQIDEGDTDVDRSIVVRDAEGGYVCEVDLHEFSGATSDGRDQARDVARLIVQAMQARAERPDAGLEPALADARDRPAADDLCMTITEQVDALIAGDSASIGTHSIGRRVEMADAVMAAGILAHSAMGPNGPDGPGVEGRLGDLAYAVLRAMRAMDMAVEDAIARTVRIRMNGRLRLDAHRDRAGAALDSARQARG